MNCHSIRLRGPWNLHTEADGATGNRRVTLPERWETLLEDAAGLVVLSRRFNCPTGLGETDQVSLLLPQLPTHNIRVLLNDGEIHPEATPQDGYRFEITQQLEPANRLTIELNRTDPDTLSTHEVFEGAVIEIQSNA
ncbi:hypothetical protein [Thalassoroseus pseudoceratinae]|uniref:hypothetical protein n=1 Tax=Thalassoroseus pseudoceratinae TaxID=2713176 RepID=UPI00141FA6F6|nr:hypothetical protein [Thalassoroseus pseudoceratinae]